MNTDREHWNRFRAKVLEAMSEAEMKLLAQRIRTNETLVVDRGGVPVTLSARQIAIELGLDPDHLAVHF